IADANWLARCESADGLRYCEACGTSGLNARNNCFAKCRPTSPFSPFLLILSRSSCIESKGMSKQVSDPKIITLDVRALGPSAAREIGPFSIKSKSPAPQEITGKYVVIWEKVGADWKLAVDIWNEGK